MHSAQIKRIGETILIACIIALMTGLWAHELSGTKEPARAASMKLEVVKIAQAVQTYRIDHGQFPGVTGSLPFCEPFRSYNGNLCLGELLGDYIQPQSVKLGTDMYMYVYYPQTNQVVIATNLEVERGIATNNRCLINNIEFWCVKLQR